MSTSSPRSTGSCNSLSKATSIAVFAFIFLASCQDNENISPLLGTWTLKAITVQNCKDPSQNVTVTFACENSGCNKYTFSADGTLKLEQFTNTGTTVTEGTYTLSNATIITHITEAQNPTTRTFNLDITEPNYLYLNEILPHGSGKCSPTTVLKK
jgi:hypothetical protein